MVASPQDTLLDIYPAERRGFAMAIRGVGVMLGPIMGPTVGGWLTETYSWRWVFYINLPFDGIDENVRNEQNSPSQILGLPFIKSYC